MIIWLTGLSGAGKTTIGKALFKRLKALDNGTVLIDGDEIRQIFDHDTSVADYSVEGRRQNANRIVEICKWLDRQNIHVVCCILCIFPDILDENRLRFPDYFEGYVTAPFSVLENRDTKGLYKAARNNEIKNVVGVDIPFSPPRSPDITINTDHMENLDEIVNHIMRETSLK